MIPRVLYLLIVSVCVYLPKSLFVIIRVYLLEYYLRRDEGREFLISLSVQYVLTMYTVDKYNIHNTHIRLSLYTFIKYLINYL